MNSNMNNNKKSTKDRVLAALIERQGEFVSGEELAENANISRNAVWKAVNALRGMGYDIGAKPNIGYVLMPSNVLSKSEIAAYLNDPSLSDTLEVYETISSTNTAAKKYAAEHTISRPIEKIFVASEQTAGRGRLGRSFYSPKDTGVYMSLLVRPEINSGDAVRLTTAVSVAVCRAIETVFEAAPQIKWVNDIYLNNKKVCGILTEAVSDFETGTIDSVVIGIGVNVSTSVFPSEIADIAGSLTASQNGSRNRLAAEIVNEFMKVCLICGDKLKVGEYIGEYRKRSMVIGRRIRILNTDETAYALGIDEDGGLEVELENGEKRTLRSGEISIRLAE